MMDEAIKNQAIDSTKDTYLKESNNKYTGFLGVTFHDLLEHLLDCYWKITTVDLESNNKKMNEIID